MKGRGSHTKTLSKEFARRLTLVLVDDNFIKKDATTINIQVNLNQTQVNKINQHTQIYNNPDNIAHSRKMAKEILEGKFRDLD